METEFLKETVEPLLDWFRENARKLAWREKPLPYYVWVSEIMLQQTRVEAVKPFFARFIQALPDVEALACCPEERLLKLWEGLGYYNRVRNMQKAAQLVTAKYGGRLPASYEELLTLPGIGSYTAGAIASIAYGLAAPAVDGNVLRVMSRITGSEADISAPQVKKQFEELVMQVIPKDRPGMFNQALMELGATVCLPNGVPSCLVCPVRQMCIACRDGRQMELPVKAPKKARRIEQRTVLVIRDSEHAAICRRPPKGLLAGLYELPNLEGRLSPEEAVAAVRQYGFSPIRVMPLGEAKHIFSHVEWRMTGYMVLVEDEAAGERAVNTADTNSGAALVYDGGVPGRRGKTNGGAVPAYDGEVPGRRGKTDGGAASVESAPLLFIEPERTERDYPIPAAFAAYVKYLSIRLGQDKFEQI